MRPVDGGDQMLAYGGLGLIIGPREGELLLNCCFELSWIWFAAHSLQYC